jgi:hypothetical protein
MLKCKHYRTKMIGHKVVHPRNKRKRPIQKDVYYCYDCANRIVRKCACTHTQIVIAPLLQADVTGLRNLNGVR